MKVGEETEVIIVDEQPTFFRHEHALKDRRSGRYDSFVPCIDEYCACPACAVSERPAYFAMYLTVIDLTGYENGKGEWIEFSKKMLVVKPTQQKKIIRYLDRHGSLRGMRLLMARAGDKDAAIGDPEFIDFVEEETLQEYVFTYTDKEGQDHEVLCDVPYDYEELMPAMDEDELRTLVGGDAPVGSRRNDDRSLGRGRQAAAAPEDDGFGPGRRVASRRAPGAVAAEEEEAEVEAPPARRPAPGRAAAAPARSAAPARPAPRAAAAAPARAPARRPAPATIDPDDLPDAGADDDTPPFDMDEPPQRAAPARAPARRAAPEPAAAAPARPAPGMAARRANLRRGT